MRTRITRYPGDKVLGFGSTAHIQKRNMWSSDDMARAAMIGVGGSVIISTLAVYLTYKSYTYFHNNYEIVRKNKNEKVGSEDPQAIRRPAKMGSNHD